MASQEFFIPLGPIDPRMLGDLNPVEAELAYIQMYFDILIDNSLAENFKAKANEIISSQEDEGQKIRKLKVLGRQVEFAAGSQVPKEKFGERRYRTVLEAIFRQAFKVASSPSSRNCAPELRRLLGIAQNHLGEAIEKKDMQMIALVNEWLMRIEDGSNRAFSNSMDRERTIGLLSSARKALKGALLLRSRPGRR